MAIMAACRRRAVAIVCCRLALTRLSFFAGAYISSMAAMNDVNSPGVSRPLAISLLPYQRASAIPMPPRNSMEGGSTDSARTTRMLVRYRFISAPRNLFASRSSALKALMIRCAENVSVPMCDITSSASWLRRVVRRTR